MTGWTLETARHIPDDELHAYLDQALSRSQCVEIECHLAECRRCQLERNAVAAVRDRTTALLAEAVPRRVRPASFEQLVAQHHARRTHRRRLITWIRRTGQVAAGFAAAVSLGWLGRDWLDGDVVATANPPAASSTTTEGLVPPTERFLVAQGPVTIQPDSTAEDRDPPAARPIELAVAPAPSRRLAAVAREERPEPVLLVDAIRADDEPFALEGFWQAVDLRAALEETAGNLPRIDGLPILDIQLQRGDGEQRPIVVVAQQHPSGRVIRTIEGPIERVEELLEKQAARSNLPFTASWPATTPPDYLGDGAGTARRGLRMLTVTGSLPIDTLNAMARGIDIRR
jgi:hypothetical protein